MGPRASRALLLGLLTGQESGCSACRAIALAAATFSESTPPPWGSARAGPPGRPGPRGGRRPRCPAAPPCARAQANGTDLGCVRVQGHGDRGESPQIGERIRARPGPGHPQHGAHRDLHRAPVERIGASRRDEDGIGAQGCGVAEDGSDVRVVDEVDQDDHEACGGQELGRWRQRAALERGQRTAMHAVPGHLPEDLRATPAGSRHPSPPGPWRGPVATWARSAPTAVGSPPAARAGSPWRPRR